MPLKKFANLVPNVINFILAILSSCIASLLIIRMSEKFKEWINSQPFYLCGLIVFSIVIVFALIFFTIYQFLNYFRLSGWSVGKTFRHYKKFTKHTNPIHWINLTILAALFISLFISLLFAYSKIEPSLEGVELIKTIIKDIFPVFFPFSICILLILFIGSEMFLKRWFLRKEETLDIALATTSGLMIDGNRVIKDETVRQTLFSLQKCDFVFVWAIHFSSVIGNKNPDSLYKLQRFLVANPNVVVYVLLQCPFCEAVIERSIELDFPYNENYVDAPIESISNCLAQSSNVKVVLRHGSPYLRSILWGKFKESKPADLIPFSTSKDIPIPQNLSTPEETFLSAIDWGGFITQEYPRGVHGSISNLIKGSVSVHGGMWNSLRLKFAYEFIKGIRLQEVLAETDKDALICLATDLKIKKKLITKSDNEQLAELIQRNKQWDSFVRRITDSAKTKANCLRASLSVNSKII